MSRHALRVAGLVVVVLLHGVAGVAQPRPDAASPAAVFDQVWRTVAEKFYDPKLNGVDWEAMRARYRPLVAAAPTPEQRAALVNEMLASLGASHTTYLVGSDPAYYDLLDIFAGAARRDLGRLFRDGEVAYTGIGVFTRAIDGRAFVSGVLAGLPADMAGLRVGDEIVSVAGRPYAPIASFVGKQGVPVTLSIRRTAGGPAAGVTIAPERIRPNRAYFGAMERSARIIERAGKRIGYIHVWSYAGSRYQALLEREIHAGVLKDADALILDLRDGWGGAQAEYLDIFRGGGPVVEIIDRSGRKTVDNAKWPKPVVMLVNGGTRSGKEILAYGFKKYRLGELVGTRTTGAVLAATIFVMADGSVLELAVDDVTVDGEHLEKVGVTPTIEVPFSLPYAGGRDPQLERALAVLSGGPHTNVREGTP